MCTTPIDFSKGEPECRVFTVFDPINRKPYQLRESDLEYTVGYKNLLEQQGTGSKRVFLCKNYQAKGCRAQKRCNSIHANKQVIAELREKFPATEEDLASEILLTAKDSATGVEFQVPKDRTAPSAGQEGAAVHPVFVCTDYDEKQVCSSGSACPFLHVEASYMRHVRIMWRVPCCASCTGMKCDFPPLGGDTEWDSFVVGSKTNIMPQCYLSLTKGLRELCAAGTSPNGVLYIPPPRVCRPHQRMACKWGADCNNVHICRQRFGAKRRPSSGCTTPKQHSESDTMSIPCLSPADKETFRLTPPLPLDGQDDPIQPLPPVALMPTSTLAPSLPVSPSPNPLSASDPFTRTPPAFASDPPLFPSETLVKEQEKMTKSERSPVSPFSPSAFSPLLAQLKSFQSLHIPLGGVSFSGCI